MSKILSKRAQKIVSKPNILLSGISKVLLNPYSENNLKGIINLGTAENKLNNKEILEKINEAHGKCVDKHLCYGSFSGSEKTRSNIARLLNRYLKPRDEIKASQIFVGNGCGPMVDMMGTVLCDEGEAFIVPEPYYGGFNSDLSTRASIDVVPVGHLKDDVLGITEEMLEEVYEKNKEKVKGIIISNPNNPFGRTYTTEQLLVFINFCHKHKLHFISDEIYALSQFRDSFDGKKANFVSVTSLDLPDPSRVHVLYGLSKDFCMNGFRIGVIMSRSLPIIAALKSYSMFCCIPGSYDTMLENLLDNDEWIDYFVSLNQKRLAENYKKITKSLKEHNIKYVDANSAYFMWIDLREQIKKVISNYDESPADAEMKFWNRLLNNGVYIAPSAAFYATEPGFFRICFATQWDILSEALERIYKSI
ncbi:PLP-dependent transferase [Piromyces finnis]|uniref:PLP-dependent transferase n=1 Tax=Piromyces finnis TaxID=1754191 RepID=A0A1Y1VHA1_9FUNG|nr:PLP-dependent transferase [Piromyces finnis]|eukprot:ORX56105.1 PLP-dependent transferase [Piromyces finnis]